MPRNFVDKSLWNTQFQVNNVNVATPGQVNSIFGALGLPDAPTYGSQGDVGKMICLSDAEAAAFSFLTQGTLFGGIYQLVQLDSGATTANAVVGMAAFLLDTAAGGGANSGSQGYVVTDAAHAAGSGHTVGVFLNTITPGNFGFIQISGKATVQYTATVTSTSISSSLVSGGATAGTWDAIVAATTGITLGQVMGVPIQAPANAALKTAQLKFSPWRY